MGMTRTGGGERLLSAGGFIDEATATLDERGTMTGWSAGAERLLGYSATEIVVHADSDKTERAMARVAEQALPSG